MNDEEWMGHSLEMAITAKEVGELPFGAVIVQGGQIVGKGMCQEKQLGTVLAHAEATAVDMACKELGTTKLTNCTIYCTNEPCVMCAAAIFQAKIPRVVIGASREDIAMLRPRQIEINALAKDSGFEIEIVRGIRKQEVLELFRDFS
jgi:tRNA(adenine34) deaminase